MGRPASAADLIYPEESYKIMGACYAVYAAMGCGFLEAVYHECLEIEFEHRGIPFTSQPELRLTYRDRILRHGYFPDMICYGKIVLELKAIANLSDEHQAQLLNYLHASKLQLGILLNFGHYPKIEYERIALTEIGRAEAFQRTSPLRTIRNPQQPHPPNP